MIPLEYKNQNLNGNFRIACQFLYLSRTKFSRRNQVIEQSYLKVSNDISLFMQSVYVCFKLKIVTKFVLRGIRCFGILTCLPYTENIILLRHTEKKVSPLAFPIKRYIIKYSNRIRFSFVRMNYRIVFRISCDKT